VSFTDGADHVLLVEATPDDVGDVALCGGVALAELRDARDGGLEQLFFSLTSNGSDEPSKEVSR
jgi:hypothetical protein